MGYEIIVADPNFAPMYATRTRKVKTDRPRFGRQWDRTARPFPWTFKGYPLQR